jgi:hypothetical protein
MVDLADQLFWQIKAAKIPGEWVRELRFHKTRRWRIDIAEPGIKLAIECEGFGASGTMGRHQSISGMTKDCEKYSELAIAGFRLIRVTGNQIKSGLALCWIERAIKYL